jgi:hypothetical protein
MQKKIAAFDQNADQIISLIEDAHELTAKELELERKAKLDELEKRNWMSLSAQQLTDRIPVSVFAMGDLATAR